MEPNQQEIDPKDLELLEKRVAELERYLGIEELDLETFREDEMETVERKAQKLDDFIKVIEDKHFFLSELFEKYEKMENFLKVDDDFRSMCMNLQRKSNLVMSCSEALNVFV